MMAIITEKLQIYIGYSEKKIMGKKALGEERAKGLAEQASWAD